MAEVVPGQRHDRSALILFGSESGNGEEVAECLGQVVERLHFISLVCEMNQVDLNFLSKATVVIFVISTTGQGEFPKNARKFWKSLLRKRLPPNCLSHVSFTSFGLGDSSYIQFNWAVRKLHKRLGQLGAQEIYPRGEADEQHNEGIDGTYLSWSADFGRHLLSLYPLPEGLVPIPRETPLPPKFYLELAGERKEEGKNEQNFDSDVQQKIRDLDLLRGGSLVGGSAKAGEAWDQTKSGFFLEQVTSTQPHPSLLAATTSTPLEATTPESTSNPISISAPLNATTNTSNRQNSPSIDSVAKSPLHAEPTNAKEPANSSHLSLVADEPNSTEMGLRKDWTEEMTDRSDDYYDRRAEWLDDIPKCDQLKEGSGQFEPRDPAISEDEKKVPFPDSEVGIVLSNSRMTPDKHWQDVRQITFAVPEHFEPMPGDVLVVYPRNFAEDVEKLIKLMGWDDVANKVVLFKECPPCWDRAEMFSNHHRGLHPVCKSTLKDLLTFNLDITAIPGRRFFQFISQYTDDETHRERLEEFTDPRFRDEFYDYTARPRRSIIEVLEDFPSVKVPWNTAVEMFPVIRGRKYSICNGGSHKQIPGSQHEGMVKVQILVAIVKYRTVLKKVRQGLCSRYISQMPVGYKVDIGIEPSSFGPKKYHPETPLILIGPGTGIAPLRSIIWERAFTPLEDEEKRQDTMLFFGGRNERADYFYANEWYTLREHVTTYTAFSRDQEKKIYVQDAIRQQSLRVWVMINAGANIFVCGSSKAMPKAVREAIVDAMEQWGPYDKNRAVAEEAFDVMMKKGGRYIEEVW